MNKNSQKYQHNELQKKVDEIIKLSSLMDICIMESTRKEVNCLDVDLILKTPITNSVNKSETKQSVPPAYLKHSINHSSKENATENGFEVLHPKREQLIHFHSHYDKALNLSLGNVFYSFFQFLRYS